MKRGKESERRTEIEKDKERKIERKADRDRQRGREGRDRDGQVWLGYWPYLQTLN
jgi:hypothetical protein